MNPTTGREKSDNENENDTDTETTGTCQTKHPQTPSLHIAHTLQGPIPTHALSGIYSSTTTSPKYQCHRCRYSLFKPKKILFFPNGIHQSPVHQKEEGEREETKSPNVVKHFALINTSLPTPSTSYNSAFPTSSPSPSSLDQ